MNFRLWRTPANQLCVLCWSSGWSPKPLVSVVDWTGSNVSTVDEPEVVLQADGLFSVSVLVNVEAVDGNFTTVTSQCVPSRSYSGLAATAPLFHLQHQETRACSVEWRSLST